MPDSESSGVLGRLNFLASSMPAQMASFHVSVLHSFPNSASTLESKSQRPAYSLDLELCNPHGRHLAYVPQPYLLCRMQGAPTKLPGFLSECVLSKSNTHHNFSFSLYTISKVNRNGQLMSQFLLLYHCYQIVQRQRHSISSLVLHP